MISHQPIPFGDQRMFHYFREESICAVDGGHEYLRRCGNPEDWEELSETQSVEN